MSILSRPQETADEANAASMVTSVVDAIVDGVMKGRYAPGQRLIAADLAEEYGVSRAPVREALHMLAGEGVVQLITNRGARIRKLGVQELVNFLEFTEAICVLGVRLSTGLAREPENRILIDAAFEAVEAAWARRSGREFVMSLYNYHNVLNEISGNVFVEFFYKRPYMRFYTSLLSEMVPGGSWDQYIHNYRLINEMILSGDAHTSVTMFVAHIRWVLRNMRAAHP